MPDVIRRWIVGINALPSAMTDRVHHALASAADRVTLTI